MHQLDLLSHHPALAEEFERLFDFYLLPAPTERETEDDHLTYTLDGRAFAADGSGGEYHLLEDGSIGYHGSAGQTGRLAETMAEFFSLLVNTICWKDYCQPTDPTDLEHYGQQRRGAIMEEFIDAAVWKRLAGELGVPIADQLAPILERFYAAAQREPRYRSFYREDDGSLTESDDLA